MQMGIDQLFGTSPSARHTSYFTFVRAPIQRYVSGLMYRAMQQYKAKHRHLSFLHNWTAAYWADKVVSNLKELGNFSQADSGYMRYLLTPKQKEMDNSQVKRVEQVKKNMDTFAFQK